MSDNTFITSETALLGLIGNPVEHSMSPIMHNTILQHLKLNYVYLAFNVLPKNLKKAVQGLKALNIKGFNVTIPYKQRILNFLDEIDPTAKKIGAVNTIKNEEGILKARNTDAMGARVALVNNGFQINNKNILILGAGGAARAVSFGLAKECNEIIIANRTLKGAEKLVMDLRQKMNCNSKSIKFDLKIIKKELASVDLLVNATPIGMFPNIDKSPLPKEILNEHLFVFDLIYNPYSTKFLSEAKGLGCQTLNGLDMLINQGAVAFEWWISLKADKKLMKTKLMEALNQDVRP